MFLLVSVRHVGADPAGEHQHGVSIQISISLGKTFLRISRIRNIPLTRILARVFLYVPPFISQILDFIYWKVLTFILIYFEWRDTENQQFSPGGPAPFYFSTNLRPKGPEKFIWDRVPSPLTQARSGSAIAFQDAHSDHEILEKSNWWSVPIC